MSRSGRIPQSFIDDLVGRVDIVDVITERVPLKKAGREFKACCPFHDEKTPSFTVSPSKQFYHCFGCGAHGTVLGFLMDYERLEFVDAIEELAGRLGLEVPRDGGAEGSVPVSRNEPLYEVLDAAQTFFTRQLRQHANAAAAVGYLKGRGLTGEIARDFGLGYAPPGWDNLVRELAPRRGEDVLVDAGLAIRSDRGSVYDRFRERVVFPIRDSRGRVIAFGGRVLKPEDTPKYLNSPETPVFHKGRELYGLWEARRANRQLDRLLVVEGYMDVVALAQHGIRYAVATLGTAATADHVERLFRSTSNVVFSFDGDEAGRRAAERALDTVLPTLRDGREVGFLFLPEGEDPDTLVRAEGAERLEAMARESVSALEFLLTGVSLKLKESPEAYARLVAEAWSKLQAMPGETLRKVARNRLRKLAGMQHEEFDEIVAAHRSAPASAAAGRPHAPGGATAGRESAPSGSTPAAEPDVAGFDGGGRNQRVRHAVRLLLHYPAVAAEASGDWKRLCTLEKPGVPLLLAMIELLQAHPGLTVGAVVERFRNHDEGRHLAKLAASGAPPGDEERMATEFRDVLGGLYEELDEQRFRLLSAKARVSSLDADEQGEFLSLIAKSPGARKRETTGR